MYLFLAATVHAANWPIGVSSNGRYFVDSAGAPYLMNFDTGHHIIALVATSGYQAYLDNRKAKGFNGVNIFGSCSSGNCPTSGSAQDGTLPFTVGSGPSTYDFGNNGANLNNAYWSKIDSLITAAAADGLVVLFSPLPAQYYDVAFVNNGATKVQQLGAAFGTRYKNNTNIIWHLGNDCQSCNLSLQKSFLDGIKSTDTSHVFTFQQDYFRSYTNQTNSGSFASEFTVDYVYTYYETYDYALAAYNSSPTIPCFLGEANYEGGNNTNQLSSVANQLIVRMENWWTVTSGCLGTVWGNESVNHYDAGYPASMDTAATLEVVNLYNLFTKYQWQNLVPDPGHTVVTAGYGVAAPSNENLYTSTYATTAWIPDGTLAITYTPVAHTLTVNMTKFSQSVKAQWYDPSAGTYSVISGSPFTNTGTQNFATPGNNHDGNPDWVLVLEASGSLPPPDTTAPSVPTGVAATAISSSQINLSWTASTDPDNTAAQLTYKVFRSGVQIATSAAGATAYSDTGLTPSTTYSYTIEGADPAGNASTQSVTVSGTTFAGPPPVSLRLNAGSSAAYTDLAGNAWTTDQFFTGGSVSTTTNAITGTQAPKVYQSDRYGNAASFQYNIPVVNGAYSVSLDFAETYVTGPGQRLFGVSINGTQVLSNFDIYATAGGMNRAITKTFPATVTAGVLNVTFTPGSIQNPKVNGIEVGQASAPPSASPCDLNQDGVVNNIDVQLAVNMAIGAAPCTANIQGLAVCDVITVQRVVNAVLTGACATGVTPHSVTMTWVGSISSNVAGYNIYRATTSGGPYTKLNSSPVSATSYVDGIVQSGQTYSYVVTTIDSSGNESAFSNQAQAVIPSP